MINEAAIVYSAAIEAQTTLFTGWVEWTNMLEGTEQAEARHWIAEMTADYERLTEAIADYNRGAE